MRADSTCLSRLQHWSDGVVRPHRLTIARPCRDTCRPRPRIPSRRERAAGNSGRRAASCHPSGRRPRVCAQQPSGEGWRRTSPIIQAEVCHESRRPVASGCPVVAAVRYQFRQPGRPSAVRRLPDSPVDWLLFGKRVAARAAARLNVDVAQAEYADLLRREIALTVDAFYDALEADVAVRLAEHTGQSRIAWRNSPASELRATKARTSKACGCDSPYSTLSGNSANDGPQLRRLRLNYRCIGRPPDTPDFVVRGTLAVRAVLAPDRRGTGVDHRRAVPAGPGRRSAGGCRCRRRGRARATSSLSAGRTVSGSRSPGPDADHWLPQRLAGIVTGATTLPFTDRNQGRIMAAESAAEYPRSARGRDRRRPGRGGAVRRRVYRGGQRRDWRGRAFAQDCPEVRDETLAAYRKGAKDLVDALDAERAYRDRLEHTWETDGVRQAPPPTASTPRSAFVYSTPRKQKTMHYSTWGRVQNRPSDRGRVLGHRFQHGQEVLLAKQSS